MNEITIRKKRVFVSAPCGYDRRKVKAWVKVLIEDGYEVFCPLNYVESELFGLISDCDAIFSLRGWEKCPSSIAEMRMAIDAGLEIMMEAN